MPVPAVHCEARKVAYRQTKDGLVVSFVIHPNDMPDALAVAPLGTRYMLAMAAIGDDEQPIETVKGKRSSQEHNPHGEGETPDKSAKPPGGCDARHSVASQRGKERYFESTAMQQALIRAGRLPKDDRFREWLGELWAISIVSEEAAIGYIRDRCCDGGSRRLIAEDPACREAFLTLETDYYAATGQMAEVR